MDSTVKYFGWFVRRYEDHTLQHARPCNAYFTNDKNIIGDKHIHTLDEIIKLNISDSKKQKIRSLKIGSYVRMSNLSSIDELILQRLDDKHINLLDELSNLTQELDYIRDILKQTPYYNDEKELVKKIAKLKKEVNAPILQKRKN